MIVAQKTRYVILRNARILCNILHETSRIKMLLRMGRALRYYAKFFAILKLRFKGGALCKYYNYKCDMTCKTTPKVLLHSRDITDNLSTDNDWLSSVKKSVTNTQISNLMSSSRPQGVPRLTNLFLVVDTISNKMVTLPLCQKGVNEIAY